MDLLASGRRVDRSWEWGPTQGGELTDIEIDDGADTPGLQDTGARLYRRIIVISLCRLSRVHV